MRFARVFLVDDHVMIREGLKFLVDAQEDMQVAGEADDGARALLGVRAVKPDVVVMDLAMPSMSGVDATRRIKGETPEMHVLVLTGADAPSSAARALDAGASGYLRKQSALDELCRAIRIVAAGGMYLDSTVAAYVLAARARATLPLSAREREALRLIARGYATKEAATSLAICPRTFETYRARAMDKLGLKSRAEIVRYALEQGWLKPD